MKKFVLKLDLNDDKDKRKALKTVAAVSGINAGIDEISINMNVKELMVIGTTDPVNVVSKLRKYWLTDIISVGPAKEPEKEDESNNNEQKVEEPKKEEQKNEESKNEEPEPMVGAVFPYRPYHPAMNTYYYYDQSMEENPNACIIC